MCVNPLSADSFTLDLGTTGGSMMGRLIQLLIMMTVLTLAPSIVMMVTSFTRIVVVFSFDVVCLFVCLSVCLFVLSLLL
jgi:flagellar biosynthetic protein FliP